MPVVMSMHWPEMTTELYERAWKEVRWEEQLPKGARFHAAWFAPDGFRVIDVWDSEAHFQAFSEQRLMPVLGTFGLQSGPNVVFSSAQRVVNAGLPQMKSKSNRGKARRGAKKAGARKARKSKRR